MKASGKWSTYWIKDMLAPHLEGYHSCEVLRYKCYSYA